MASRFPPRDRSPHRYGDRRPHIPSGPRGGDDANSIPLGREPPRGPKALIDSSRGGHFAPAGPRGRGIPRGISGRGEYRDRDPRDLRDGPPPFRRDPDRDWPRRDRGFDSRDTRPPFGRGRSRSPPLRDFRDAGPRDLDIPRLRRGSRDGPLLMPDASPLRGGSFRGRGRGDRDRGRGKGFLDDRDLFRRRSLSRDAWRDRDSRFDRDRDREREWDRERERERERERDRERDRDRDRERERERDNERRGRFERREDDRRPERDERDERDRAPDRPDTWRKDRAPSRIEPKSSSNTATVSPSTVSPPLSAAPFTTPKPDIPDVPQKSAVLPTTSVPDQPKPLDKVEAPPPRSESFANHPVPQFVSMSTVSDVPAFGASASSTTPSRGKAQLNSMPGTANKLHNDAFASGSVRPPTGPRAERVESHAPDFRSRRLSVSDARSKNDLSIRPSKPPPASPPAPPTLLPDRRAVTPSAQDRSSLTSINPEEKPLLLPRQDSGPISPPIGPSVALSQGFGRAPVDTNSSPVAHRRPSTSQTSPQAPFSNIPTGPRALQRPIAPRGGPKGSNQWVRPGYVNRGPPIANAGSPTKRDSFTDDKDMISSVSNESRSAEKQHDEKTESIETEPKRLAEAAANETNVTSTPIDTMSSEKGEVGPVHNLKDDSLLPMFLAESSGEVSDEEDDLDEEDFNQGEQRFEKEMQALAAEMPPPPLEDPVIVSLLFKIQMLGIIAEGAVPTSLDEPSAAIETENPSEPPAVVPLPSTDANEIELPDAPPSVAPPEEAPVAEAPSLEALPFLNTGPPTPFSDMDTYQETLKTHDMIKDTLREEIIKQRKEIAKQHADLREQYRAYYRPWRLAVSAMDRKKAAEDRKSAAPGPSTPPASSSSAAAIPPLEGRRGYRMNSELDFQNALKASAITAEEENARRRDQEATARPDLAREAPIPDMFDDIEKRASVFQDTNQIIDPSKAFEVFAFHLPPDDFTPEEHKIFTDTFMSHPKKWGRIAQALPGRTFQQCINHYYLTKEEMKYKVKLNKKWARRGRGRRTVARPPKSNALMADLGVVRPVYDGDEATETTPAVTDTGRPRRAAAPTFGEMAADTETSTPTPSGGKRNSGKEGPDQPPDKPARRGGRGGNRGGRRARAQQPLNNTPIAAAPPKPQPELSVENVTKLATPRPKSETEKAFEVAAPRTKSTRVRAKEPKEIASTAESTEGESAPKQTGGGYGSQQPTSYWSVPEQRDFPELVAHFGRDFEGISQFMKTKTPTMVRNYFQRNVDSGENELEELASIAEAKKQKGEATGPLPVPSLPTKRRYDAAVSSAGPRPLAPNTDTAEHIDRKVKLQVVPLAAAPPPIQPRQSIDKAQSQQALYPSVQARGASMLPLSASEESHQRAARQQAALAAQRMQQQQQHGPRMGYFSENRPDNRSVPAQGNIAASHLQELELKRQQPQAIAALAAQVSIGSLHPQNMNRSNLASLAPDAQEALRYHSISQASQYGQPSYLQPRPSVQAATSSRSHSRRPSNRSISSTATSPVQLHSKMELSSGAMASVDMLNQPKPTFRQPTQFLDINRSTPAVLSPHEASRPNSRPNSTSAPANAEPPRQVPAKRSNIMSILNDEPEDPQPRKKFASGDFAAPTTASRPASPRPVYAGNHSTPSRSIRPEDHLNTASQQYQRSKYTPAGSHQLQSPHPLQHQQSHSQMSTAQQYPDFSGNYKASSGGSSLNQDWMARFDPRGQQQSSQSPNSTDQHISRLARQPSTSHTYSNTGLSHSVSMSNLQSTQSHPSPQHQSQRPPFTHQILQQSQSAQQSASARDSPMSQHLQPFSQPGSPSIQRHSISYTPKSSHPRPTSPNPPSGSLKQTPHPQSTRYSGYAPSNGGHQIQPVLENQPQAAHLYRQNVQGGAPQQYSQSARRVPSLSPRHQPSHLPPSQHLLAQHELQAQRQHRASLNLGQQSDSPFSRNPPPSQVSNLSRGTGYVTRAVVHASRLFYRNTVILLQAAVVVVAVATALVVVVVVTYIPPVAC
ncbi:predicted protein [Uncinocarpus reesii 1704]|uniref:SANT domain-containing protein n=1 Tax=Uncinocarpus reesii (strain UAMH 1704) TaxID=336963 RepID=C4JMF8_UNCRE|nr:uncharacterized protein UREG_04016 [Uncinocarpus reesii 1704]EEP79170.1 predicted protein [Uncinocarpus reesii 1704]